MDSAWDRLLELVDHLAADATAAGDPGVERAFAALTAEAIEARDIDIELHTADVARWLTGLVAAYHVIRATHVDVDADADLADLRRIITRWLHPARPR
jgi:hypothetical protein|nr:hypothetical protein [Aeromicrobium sp.]